MSDWQMSKDEAARIIIAAGHPTASDRAYAEGVIMADPSLAARIAGSAHQRIDAALSVLMRGEAKGAANE